MKTLLYDKESFEALKRHIDNPHANPSHEPEEYPCIIVWEKHDCDGYGGFYISYDYVYPTDFVPQ